MSHMLKISTTLKVLALVKSLFYESFNIIFMGNEKKKNVKTLSAFFFIFP